MAGPNATIIGRVAVKVVPNTDDFRRDAQRELSAVERALDDINITFKADFRDAVTEVRDAVREAQKAAKDVDIEVDVGQLSKRKAQAELAFLARTRIAQIIPRVNKTAAAKATAALAALSGGRAFKDLATDFADWVGELDRSVPRIATVTSAVSGLSAALLASTSNVFAFGGSLATTAGAALALPGILGGMALGAGAFIAVIKDMNKIVPGLADRFHDLQDSMSGRFWSIAEAPFRSFIRTIFPQFADGLSRTATSLGGFFAALSDSARNVFNDELASMFDDLNRSIDISSRFTDNFIGILEKLGSVGAGNLPRLSRWFGDISRTFDNWLGRKGQNGLQEYVDTGVAALQDLGGVISATSSLLAGLARAAERAGGGTLAGLREAMEGAAEAVNSSRFQGALTDTFEAAHKAMGRISKQSGPEFRGFMLRLSSTLTKVLPRAGDVVGKALGGIFDALDRPRVEKAVVDAFDSLNEAVDNLLPGLPGLAKALAGILDVVADVTVNVSRALGPAIENLSPVIEDLARDLKPLIKQLGDLLVNAVELASPVVEDLGGILGEVAGAVADILKPINGFIDLLQQLPDPVKDVASKAAAAAGAFALLSAALAGIKASAIGQMIGNLGSLSGTMKNAEKRAVLFKNAMRGAAGVGGMLAFSAAAGETDDAMKNVYETLGLAAVGFSVGGPWGAAVGGAIGLIGTFNEAMNRPTIENTGAFSDALDGLKDSFIGVGEAAREAVRQQIAQDLVTKGLIQSAKTLGISSSDVVSAVLGQEGATKRLSKAIDDNRNKGGALATLQQGRMSDAANNLESYLGKAIPKYEEFTQKNRDAHQATRTLAERLEKLPKDVKLKLKALDYQPTIKQLKDIAQEGKGLNNKQIKILIKALNSKATVQQLKGVKREAENVGKAKPNMGNFERLFKSSMGRVKSDATLGGLAVARNLKTETGKARPNFNPFAVAMPGALAPAKAAATTGGQQIGSNLQEGIVGGFGGTLSRLASMASSAVSSAVAAAKAAAKIKSPSRKMMEVGRFMGEGLVIGLERKIKSAKNAGDKLAKAVFNKNFVKSLAKATKQAEDIFRKLLDKVGKKGAATMRRRFGDEVKALSSLAQQMQSIAQKMRDTQKQVAQTVIDFANPVDIGGNYDGIVTSLQDAAVQAEHFQKVIKGLIKQGLNKTTLRQILAAGPEAGLATAEAILGGGVKQINKIQKEINKSAQGVGKASGQYLFGGLLDQAQADVDKLIGKLGPLQKRLKQFAQDLVDSLRKEMNKQFKKAKAESAKKVTSVAGSKPKSASGTTAKAAAKSATATGGASYTLNYYASGGSKSLSSEEQLFAAARRGRMAFTR